MVSEDVYREWEKQVIAAFLDANPRRTPLIPTDGSPSVLKRAGAVLVALQAPGDVAEAVASSEGLPLQRKLQLFHPRARELVAVSYGLDVEHFIFQHPACDLRGPSNFTQHLGELADLAPDAVPVDKNCEVGGRAQLVFDSWSKLSGRALPEAARADVVAWLRSVLDALGDIVVRFHLPREHCVLVTSSDVRRTTGKYYVRDPKIGAFVLEPDGAGLCCEVAEGIVTPGVSFGDVELLYSAYDVEAPSSLGVAGDVEPSRDEFAGTADAHPEDAEVPEGVAELSDASGLHARGEATAAGSTAQDTPNITEEDAALPGPAANGAAARLDADGGGFLSREEFSVGFGADAAGLPQPPTASGAATPPLGAASDPPQPEAVEGEAQEQEEASPPSIREEGAASPSGKRCSTSVGSRWWSGGWSTPRHRCGHTPGDDFERLDVDGDGFLSREEFSIGFGAEAAGLPQPPAASGATTPASDLRPPEATQEETLEQEAPQDVVERLDAGGDGFASHEEASASAFEEKGKVLPGPLVANGGPTPGDDFERLDVDGDGFLSREEFAMGFGAEAAGLPQPPTASGAGEEPVLPTPHVEPASEEAFEEVAVEAAGLPASGAAADPLLPTVVDPAGDVAREAIMRNFERLDTDGDGFLSREEFAVGFGSEAAGLAVASGTATTLLPAELAPAAASVDTEEAQEAPEADFVCLDAASHGPLSREDFAAAFGKEAAGLAEPGAATVPPEPPPEAAPVEEALVEDFERLDTDGDGFLSLEEFAAGFGAGAEAPSGAATPEEPPPEDAEAGFEFVVESAVGFLSSEEPGVSSGPAAAEPPAPVEDAGCLLLGPCGLRRRMPWSVPLRMARVARAAQLGHELREGPELLRRAGAGEGEALHCLGLASAEEAVDAELALRADLALAACEEPELLAA